jgi:hypothetical protein
VYWLSAASAGASSAGASVAASVGAAVLAVVELLLPQAARAKIMHMTMIKLMSFFIILFLSSFCQNASFSKYPSEIIVNILTYSDNHILSHAVLMSIFIPEFVKYQHFSAYSLLFCYLSFESQFRKIR